MPVELYDWQRPASDKLTLGFLSGATCMLQASDTGTGKTLIALDTAKRLGSSVLVSCPKAVKPTWWRWAADMGLSDKLLDVINPERISLGRTKWWDGNAWHIPANTLVVIDEAHKGIAGPDSKMTRAVAILKAYPGTKVLLQSATIADSPLQMRALGYLLGLHKYSRDSFYPWCLQHGCYKSNFHRGLEFSKGAKGRAAMATIHKQIVDRMVRLRIGEIPGFPESFVEAKLFELDKFGTEETNKAYEEAAESLKSDSSNPMVVLLRAQQRAELMKVPVLTELALDAVEEGNSAVVFVHFKDTMYSLLRELKDLTPASISGDDKDEALRQANVEAFQADRTPVLVATTAAGGAGISLHNADGQRPRRSFLTPDYSASVIRQALGRIHRAGGSNVVQTICMAAGTVEEKVYKALSAKLSRMDLLQDGDLTGGLV